MTQEYREGITEKLVEKYVKAGLELLLVNAYYKKDDYSGLRINIKFIMANERMRSLLKELASKEREYRYGISKSGDFEIADIRTEDARHLLSLGVPASKTLQSILEGKDLEVQYEPRPSYTLSIFVVEGDRMPATIESVDAILARQKEGVVIKDAMKLECWEVLLSGKTERHLSYDSKSNDFVMKFPYDERLINFVKGIPSAKWNPKDKKWELKKTDWVIKHLNSMLEYFFFSVAPEVRDILVKQGAGQENGRIRVSRTKDGYNALFQFDYCPDTIQALKKMGAKWDKKLNKWRMPVLDENKATIAQFR